MGRFRSGEGERDEGHVPTSRVFLLIGAGSSIDVYWFSRPATCDDKVETGEEISWMLDLILSSMGSARVELSFLEMMVEGC